MKSRYQMFAAYNAWANARVFGAAATLTDADYRADRGAFFKSVHGTLNHLLVADRIWMRRFTDSGEAPSRLDAILFEDRGALWEARQAEDARIARYIDGLADADFSGRLVYRTIVQPRTLEQDLWPALDHFFNHQTHHRGQVHGLLSAIGGNDAAPSLDLLLYQRDAGASFIR